VRRTILLGTIVISTFIFAMHGFAKTSLLLGGFDPASDAPVEMTADKLTISEKDGSAQFEGNVIIGQGDIRIAANLVTVTYSETGEIDKLSASGGVTVATTDESAESDFVEYSLKNRTLVMTGNVLFSQGKILMSANSLQIDLKTGAATVEGQVKTILSSGSD
jgi:lipopolysaccharide export system protein LptA